jgi:hypothetical protein
MLEGGERAEIHREDKVIKVGHHIVNRADRTACLPTLKASARAFKPLRP